MKNDKVQISALVPRIVQHRDEYDRERGHLPVAGDSE
jgi:hypothetical protein